MHTCSELSKMRDCAALCVLNARVVFLTKYSQRKVTDDDEKSSGEVCCSACFLREMTVLSWTQCLLGLIQLKPTPHHKILNLQASVELPFSLLHRTGRQIAQFSVKFSCPNYRVTYRLDPHLVESFEFSTSMYPR